jgi:hypothetical protein
VTILCSAFIHSIARMAQRLIEIAAIQETLRHCTLIEDYPNDSPCPSRLMLSVRDTVPLHVVAAYNAADDKTIVITVYRPDPLKWSSDVRTRRSS